MVVGGCGWLVWVFQLWVGWLVVIFCLAVEAVDGEDQELRGMSQGAQVRLWYGWLWVFWLWLNNVGVVDAVIDCCYGW